MPQTEQRLKSPDRKKLAAYIKVCYDALELAESDGAEPEAIFCNDDVQELMEMLEWALTFLCNRTDYHKKKQMTDKMTRQLLIDRALAKGIDVEALRKEARARAADQIIDESDELPVLPKSQKGGADEQ